MKVVKHLNRNSTLYLSLSEYCILKNFLTSSCVSEDFRRFAFSDTEIAAVDSILKALYESKN